MSFLTVTRLSLLSVAALVLTAVTAPAKQFDCGQPVSTGARPTAVDALVVLRAAVGNFTLCEQRNCACDPDDSGTIRTTDALLVLRAAVGLSVPFHCRCEVWAAVFGSNGAGSCDSIVVDLHPESSLTRLARDQDGDVLCTINESLGADGCSLIVVDSPGKLLVTVTGCTFLSAGELFRCFIEVGNPVTLLDESTATCECASPDCDPAPPVCMGEYVVICQW